MARKTVFVSDFTGKEIADDREAVQVTLRYADARKGQLTADAHVNDQLIKQIEDKGKKTARRGRKPKAA